MLFNDFNLSFFFFQEGDEWIDGLCIKVYCKVVYNDCFNNNKIG